MTKCHGKGQVVTCPQRPVRSQRCCRVVQEHWGCYAESHSLLVRLVGPQLVICNYHAHTDRRRCPCVERGRHVLHAHWESDVDHVVSNVVAGVRYSEQGALGQNARNNDARGRTTGCKCNLRRQDQVRAACRIHDEQVAHLCAFDLKHDSDVGNTPLWEVKPCENNLLLSISEQISRG